MIYSMTGFGRYEHEEEGRKVSVEIKSVNHRYLDLNIRMPRRFNRFEADLRKLLGSYMSRGKVDVSISFEDMSESAASLSYNQELAAAYLKYCRQMAEDLGLENDVRVSTLMRMPEVFTMETPETDEEALYNTLAAALEKAAEAFQLSRQKEGEALKEDLLAKLSDMAENVRLVEERYPAIIKEYEDRLRQKLADTLADTRIDESVLATELVVFSDRLCTDEETVRLANHIDTMAKELKKGGAVGRKLDFVAQEMNREANTILSKSNDLRTSEIGISLKTEIEKIREQIQNLE